MNVTDFLERFDRVRRCGRGWSALCPAHGDRSPSLSIATGEQGRLLVRCMAGCKTSDVLAAVGLEMADLFVDNDRKPKRSALHCRRSVSQTRKSTPPKPEVDLLPHVQRWHASSDLSPLVKVLGVSGDALRRLRVGRAPADELATFGNAPRPAWTFPMRDQVGEIIGCRLRYDDGSKRAVKGSRQGLFYEPSVSPLDGVLFIAEGPSDTAALMTLRLPGIGLPSAGQGGDLLVRLCDRLRPKQQLLIADADEPGRRGMHTVAERLAASGYACRVTDPPGQCQDARAYLEAGGDTAGILALLAAPAMRTAVWS